ncbi:MAG: hypothetical protein E7470_06510 [Ruminococcaceae bacterium]|nr:hypothetical protein [Oscillospiraceae bacterium]
MGRKKWIIIAVTATVVLLVAVIAAIIAAVGLPWGFAREVSAKEAQLRTEFVEAAEQWLGKNSRDGSHKEIIDLYNAHEPLAQNYTVQYDDKWCATFVSATAIVTDLTDIIPTECGCERQIELFKELDSWEENDAYTPLPGDVIYYCSSDKGIGDCEGWSDHVGIVVGTCGHFLKVIEGNVGSTVAYRYLPLNAITIRGYGLPDFDSHINKTPTE